MAIQATASPSLSPATGAPAAPSGTSAALPSPGMPMTGLKQAMPTQAGQPNLLNNAVKAPFGQLPSSGGGGSTGAQQSDGGGSQDPIQQAWQDKYKQAMQQAQQAKDPALKAHFEAEAKVIKTTLDAMSGKGQGGTSGGAAGTDGNGGASGAANGAGGSNGSAGCGNINQYRNAINAASKASGVPACVLAGVIWQESRAKPNAGSTNGGNGLTDSGLMQVNPNTFKDLQSRHPELQGKNLSDPTTNIMAGAFYLSELKQKFGSWPLTLRAYNSGENGVNRNNPNATPAGTGDPTYIPKVMQFAMDYQQGKQMPD